MSKKNIVVDFVPICSENIEIYPLETGLFLIQQKRYGYNLQVNQDTVNALSLVDGKRNIEDIRILYKEYYESDISELALYALLHDKMVKYGIIVLDEFNVKKKKREKHLFLSFTIFRSKIVNKIVKYFTFLSNKKVFLSLFSFTLIFSFFTVLSNLSIYSENLKEILSANFLFTFLLLYSVVIFHEFGHAAAGKKFGGDPKDIGFGFNWILPVFFQICLMHGS